MVRESCKRTLDKCPDGSGPSSGIPLVAAPHGTRVSRRRKVEWCGCFTVVLTVGAMGKSMCEVCSAVQLLTVLFLSRRDVSPSPVCISDSARIHAMC